MSGIRFKHYIFKPTFIPSLVTLALLGLMVWLGLWQLDRAAFKNNIQSQIESNKNKDEIAIFDLTDKKNDSLYQPVFASGRFDVEHQIYLDNQIHNGVTGYTVFTPMWLSDFKTILVNRGWVPLGKSRSILPEAPIDSRVRHIHGFIANAPSSGIKLSDNANTYKSWPAVLQYIDIKEIGKKIASELMPVILVMNREKETTLKPLPVNISMRSEKHTAYAFQWFGLSLALFIIYIVVNTTNTQKK